MQTELEEKIISTIEMIVKHGWDMYNIIDGKYVWTMGYLKGTMDGKHKRSDKVVNTEQLVNHFLNNKQL